MADPVACVDCPLCAAERGEPCRFGTGHKRSRPHAARVKACQEFVADAYCQNESQAGYSCGRSQCPHCAEVPRETF